MATLAELRERAKQHARHIDAVVYVTVQDLAARWGVDDETVRLIPREQLPYLEFGKSRMRRYNPDDVLAYEASAKAGAAT
jgi:hypothetical protein